MKGLSKIAFWGLVFCASRCGQDVGERIYTPVEFKNNVQVEPNLYENDKQIILAQLKEIKDNGLQSFYSNEYFDSTVIIIDSIIYSSDFNKVVIFAIAKNPITRQLKPNLKYEWYYNAYCYLATRREKTFELQWLKVFNLINFYDENEISEEIKLQYFTEFATLKDTGGKYVYPCNLNDKRFWSSTIWDKHFQK